ncbi:hypothetical protein AB0F71_19925 [Kitasatospora sp. NPDC028055]|uniref:hypothetical protein n=1 Tax=Kitasatospora sp. NPDC028055 TaxID=3155653 RepID=UPI0033ED38C8
MACPGPPSACGSVSSRSSTGYRRRNPIRPSTSDQRTPRAWPDYQTVRDVVALTHRPQYLRSLDPGRLRAIHSGATTELTGPAHSVQLVLTGGYLHTVSTRTDGRDSGPFTADQLRPAVTITELPGSSYTLGTALAHQALMRPDTTTLMLRGPYTATAHAATDRIPPSSSWPRPVDGARPVHSRPMTDAEHHALYESLAAAGVIEPLPRGSR